VRYFKIIKDYLGRGDGMGLYRIADLAVNMECIGQTMDRRAEPYRINEDTPADITIALKEERLKAIQQKYCHLTLDEVEYIQAGFAFSRALLGFDGFCLHASAIALDQRAVLFSAPCGTGKSTHAGLWQQYFGSDKALIINDDKPAMRFLGGTFYVYGTPWSGKSDLNLNLRVPLQAIVFLEQAKENRIRRMKNKESVMRLVYQSLRPFGDKDKMNRLLELFDSLIKRIPVYLLGCTVSTEVVELVYNTINKEQEGCM
jgi:hypothetical protein